MANPIKTVISKTPIDIHAETGMEELRRLVSNANHTAEHAFDDFNLEQCVNLLRACRELDLEVMADMLTPAERRHAARTGKVSRTALRRLYRAEGLELTGKDWE